MFTFFLQLTDLIKLHTVGFFLVFFILTWVVHLIKIYRASQFTGYNYPKKFTPPSISLIIPVVDEPADIWRKVLHRVRIATHGLNSQVIVVANGKSSELNANIAEEEFDFQVERLSIPSKRYAIFHASQLLTGEITFILDSDTILLPKSLKKTLRAFAFSNVGGAMPKQRIFNRKKTVMRLISDWLEDIRFREVVTGQTVAGDVSCLCGRLLAIRTDLLKKAVNGLATQTFLGSKCISGDDRYLTSWLLKNGWKTLYIPDAEVLTNAPDTLEGFAKQRLRWSRTSLRETILSVTWMFKHPYMAFTLITYVFMKWIFFAVLLTAVLALFGVIPRTHYFELNPIVLVIGTVVGFFISGFLRQLGHLKQKPSDLIYLPVFLLVTTFILTPVEWWGNLTLRESGWMTRRTK